MGGTCCGTEYAWLDSCWRFRASASGQPTSAINSSGRSVPQPKLNSAEDLMSRQNHVILSPRKPDFTLQPATFLRVSSAQGDWLEIHSKLPPEWFPF